MMAALATQLQTARACLAATEKHKKAAAYVEGVAMAATALAPIDAAHTALRAAALGRVQEYTASTEAALKSLMQCLESGDKVVSSHAALVKEQEEKTLEGVEGALLRAGVVQSAFALFVCPIPTRA